MRETGQRRIKAGVSLVGMCCTNNKLYTVERLPNKSCILTLYLVDSTASLILLDSLDLNCNMAWRPRSGQNDMFVYVPIEKTGVLIARRRENRVVKDKMLKCVTDPSSVAEVSPGRLYVCDWETEAVYLVDTAMDRTLVKLQKPLEIEGKAPYHLAVLKETVLVRYAGDDSLVVYRHDENYAQGKLVSSPKGLRSVRGITTDNRYQFLLTDQWAHAVFVIDQSGKYKYTINIPGKGKPWDCVLRGTQLWVGCDNGDIVVMASH